MSTLNHESVWKKCLEVFKDNISPQSFKTWFKPVKPLKLEHNVLTIQVPSQFFYEWLEEHYLPLIKKTIKRFLGQDGRLEYSVIVENHHDESKRYAVSMPASTSVVPPKKPSVNAPLGFQKQIPNPFVIPGLQKVTVDSRLNKNATFENFVEGNCNRLARAAGYAVATKPGQTAFNPLVLYGGVGLGKTHLVQAIGNEIRSLYPNKVILYTSAEKFYSQFIDSVQNQSISDFLNFYQILDVLIVDDIQFLGGKEKTQENFFHVFNHLHQSGKQIILTSDRAPKDLQNITDRLISRFKWGLTAEVQAPDFDTRLSILRNKMYQDGIEISEEVLEYIAHNVTSNVRELEGALISLLAQSSLNRKEIDLMLAKEMLKNFVKNVSKEISIEYIQKLVCEHMKINLDDIKGKTRKREIVQARHVSMYFAKELTKSSLKTIGSHFGGRDHSTVIHAVQTVNDLIETDKDFKKSIEELKRKISINYQ